MMNLTRTADYLSENLEAMGFIIMSQKSGKGLPLVAFRISPKMKKNYDEFAIAHHLRERSWIVPAYTMAPKTEELKMLRVVVREDFSKSRCDQLLSDIKIAMSVLDELGKEDIKKWEANIRRHQTASGKVTHNHPQFRNETHSLQGKHGKTHAVC